MGAYGPAMFADDISCDVRSEYSALLSVGKSTSQAEEMLCQYYKSILNCNDPDEEVFWFALALCEWKKGRLSDLAKSKALYFLENGKDLERWNDPDNKRNYVKRKKVLDELKKTLLSPMPEPKKIRKPTVHHCPWRVGSLLAYRIVTNKKLADDPCYKKYALLRVIKIIRYPVSKLAPNEYYSESMLVGLYGWIGDEIPDAKIVKDLDYILVHDYAPQASIRQVDPSLLNGLENSFSKEFVDKMSQVLSNLSKRRIETCADLDWIPLRGEEVDFTFLDCDESYQKSIPVFFNTSVTAYSMTHPYCFDITLSQRLKPYLEKGIK